MLASRRRTAQRLTARWPGLGASCSAGRVAPCIAFRAVLHGHICQSRASGPPQQLPSYPRRVVVADVLEANRRLARDAIEVTAIPRLFCARGGNAPDAIQLARWQRQPERLVEQLIRP